MHSSQEQFCTLGTIVPDGTTLLPCGYNTDGDYQLLQLGLNDVSEFLAIRPSPTSTISLTGFQGQKLIIKPNGQTEKVDIDRFATAYISRTNQCEFIKQCHAHQLPQKLCQDYWDEYVPCQLPERIFPLWIWWILMIIAVTVIAVIVIAIALWYQPRKPAAPF